MPTDTKKYHKEYSAKWAKANREKLTGYMRKYRAKHPEKYKKAYQEWNGKYLGLSRAKSGQRRRTLKKYGLTIDEYQILLTSQNGTCAICFEKAPEKESLVVDHNHKTGKVRGLLCRSCNLSLGNIKENIQSIKNMITYVEKFYVKEDSE